MQEGIKEAMDQLRAALEQDPAGLGKNDTARAIIEKFNEEIAKMSGAGDGSGRFADGPDGDYDDDEDYDEEEDEATRPRVAGKKPPTPAEVWRKAHEVQTTAKEVGTDCRRSKQ